jgi:hypothetical protein
VVQRASISPAGEATQAGADQEKEGEAAAAEEGMEVEQMARSVYRILRRRLRVEIERARGWQ